MATSYSPQFHCLTSDNYSDLKTNNNNCDLPSAKFEAFYQEQIASPNSTEYTDDLSEAPMEIQRFNSDSSRFYEEISAFEPIVDISSQVECNFKVALRSDFNLSTEKIEKQDVLETPQTADQSSQDEASSMNEEFEEEEELETEIKNWNEKKDKILKNLAAKCKYDWKKIAKKFNANENTDITPADLKQKYKELTKVSIPLRVKFSHQEDLMIAKYFDLYGCDWTQIASHFNDRTAMMLKNRYYSHIRKKNLLSSMLEEVQDAPISNKNEEVSTASNSQSEKSKNVECVSENEKGLFFNNFSMFTINPAFYEFEDPFPSTLHETITICNF